MMEHAQAIGARLVAHRPTISACVRTARSGAIGDQAARAADCPIRRCAASYQLAQCRGCDHCARCAARPAAGQHARDPARSARDGCRGTLPGAARTPDRDPRRGPQSARGAQPCREPAARWAPSAKRIAVFAMLKDKDIAGVVRGGQGPRRRAGWWQTSASVAAPRRRSCGRRSSRAGADGRHRRVRERRRGVSRSLQDRGRE